MLTRVCFLIVLWSLGVSDCLAAAERTIDKTFPVAGRALLKVDTFYGNIRVRTTERPEVRAVIRASVEGLSAAAADRQLSELEVTLDAEPGGAVDLRAAYKKRVRWSWEKWPPVRVEMELWVPSVCDLDLVSRQGSIVVDQVKGQLKIRALDGPVFVGEVDGSVTVWSAKGDIAVTACRGGLNLIARAGNVVVGRALGPAEISVSGGTVEVQAAHFGLRAEAEGGEMKIGFAYPLAGYSILRTSSGDLTVTFAEKIAASIEARAARSHQVSARGLALRLRSGGLGTSRLQADLNGGGPQITARSSGGGVYLIGLENMPELP